MGHDSWPFCLALVFVVPVDCLVVLNHVSFLSHMIVRASAVSSLQRIKE